MFFGGGGGLPEPIVNRGRGADGAAARRARTLADAAARPARLPTQPPGPHACRRSRPARVRTVLAAASRRHGCADNVLVAALLDGACGDDGCGRRDPLAGTQRRSGGLPVSAQT